MKNDNSGRPLNTPNPDVPQQSSTITGDSLGGHPTAAGQVAGPESERSGKSTPFTLDNFGCRLAFSVGETAKILGLSEKSIRRLISRGHLRCCRLLRNLLIPKKEIEKLLDLKTTK